MSGEWERFCARESVNWRRNAGADSTRRLWLKGVESQMDSPRRQWARHEDGWGVLTVPRAVDGDRFLWYEVSRWMGAITQWMGDRRWWWWQWRWSACRWQTGVEGGLGSGGSSAGAWRVREVLSVGLAGFGTRSR